MENGLRRECMLEINIEFDRPQADRKDRLSSTDISHSRDQHCFASVKILLYTSAVQLIMMQGMSCWVYLWRRLAMAGWAVEMMRLSSASEITLLRPGFQSTLLRFFLRLRQQSPFKSLLLPLAVPVAQ